MLETTHETWEGPLPSPEIIGRFNDVVPNGGARIFAEWEAESSHRRRLESQAFAAERLERLGSRVLAFLFAIAALSTSAFCAYVGQPWPAGLIASGTIATVVVSFLRSQK
jgi:uncharacterized membrane protein